MAHVASTRCGREGMLALSARTRRCGASARARQHDDWEVRCSIHGHRGGCLFMPATNVLTLPVSHTLTIHSFFFLLPLSISEKTDADFEVRRLHLMYAIS